MSQVVVRLMNPSDQDVELRAKTTAALCHPSEAWNENGLPTANIRSVHVQVQPQLQDVPEHLTDFIQRSSTHLSEDQIQIMSQLLVEYQDIFAKDFSDLGRTD